MPSGTSMPVFPGPARQAGPTCCRITHTHVELKWNRRLRNASHVLLASKTSGFQDLSHGTAVGDSTGDQKETAVRSCRNRSGSVSSLCNGSLPMPLRSPPKITRFSVPTAPAAMISVLTLLKKHWLHHWTEWQDTGHSGDAPLKEEMSFVDYYRSCRVCGTEERRRHEPWASLW